MTRAPPQPIAGTLRLNPDRSLRFPEKYHKVKALTITFPYAKEIINGRTVQWFSREVGKEKPYIADGHCSFKPFGGEEEVYKVVEADGVTPAAWK